MSVAHIHTYRQNTHTHKERQVNLRSHGRAGKIVLQAQGPEYRPHLSREKPAQQHSPAIPALGRQTQVDTRVGALAGQPGELRAWCETLLKRLAWAVIETDI